MSHIKHLLIVLLLILAVVTTACKPQEAPTVVNFPMGLIEVEQAVVSSDGRYIVFVYDGGRIGTTAYSVPLSDRWLQTPPPPVESNCYNPRFEGDWIRYECQTENGVVTYDWQSDGSIIVGPR